MLLHPFRPFDQGGPENLHRLVIADVRPGPMQDARDHQSRLRE
jgi:hypothetical protein